MPRNEPPRPLGALILTVPILLIQAPIIVLSVLARRVLKRTHVSFKDDLLRSIIRSLPHKLPNSVVQYLSSSTPNTTKLLSSPRFQSYRNNNLCERVSTNDFLAYWVCRSLSSAPPQTKKTLFWIHGGAYILGHALAATSSHIRVSEILAKEENIQLGVLSLDYTLAPGATFPTQIDEAVAAYRYLLDVEKIVPEDIIVGGDSAGGHLALAFLLAVQDLGLEKPSGAVLVYPWVDLTNSGKSFERNKDVCMLTKESLDQHADAVLGGGEGRKRHSKVLNFAKPRGEDEMSWKEILPARMWVNVGSDDVFVDDVMAFCANAERDGAHVVLNVAREKCHGWSTLEDNISGGRYCGLEPGDEVPEGVMAGSRNLAEGLIGVILGR